MSDDRVRIGITGPVATVTLARADKHNALDPPMFEQLAAAIDELRARRDVRAVVLHGAGPSFCSGLDFASVAAAGEEVRERLVSRAEGEAVNRVQRVAVGWLELPVPVIAALHGHVLGGGLQIALGADVRVASPDVRMSVMETVYGLVPDMGITRTLPALVRLDVAKELVWSSRVVGAEEGLELGLVTRVDDDPLAAALDLAGTIASRSPHVIRASKRLLDEAWATPGGLFALESELQSALRGSPNQLAAMQAATTQELAAFADPT